MGAAEIEFPVFLKDKDAWMYLMKTPTDLSCLEKPDVEKNEYVGWDSSENPIEVVLTNNAIGVRLKTTGTLESGAPGNSILNYARIVGPKDVSLDGDGQTVLKLLKTMWTSLAGSAVVHWNREYGNIAVGTNGAQITKMKYLSDERLIGHRGWLLGGRWGNRIFAWSGLRLTVTNQRIIFRYFGLIPIFELSIKNIKHVYPTIYGALLPWPAICIFYVEDEEIQTFTFVTYGRRGPIMDLFKRAGISIRPTFDGTPGAV